MKRLLLFLLFILPVFPCAAQTTCDLDLNNAPSLFGIRLGMTQLEVQNVLGKAIKFKPKKNGTRSFFQNFIKNEPPQALSGVRALYLRFFEDRLYQIEIFYEEKSERQTAEEFRAALLTNLQLPAADWQFVKGRAILKCAGFTLAADKVLNPRIELTDELTLAKFKESQQKINAESGAKKSE